MRAVLALMLVSCGGSSSGPEFDPEARDRLADFVEQAARVEAQHVRLLDRASSGFTVDLSTDLPAPNTASRFDIEALINLHRVYRHWLASAYRLWATGFRGAAAGAPGRRTEPLLGGALAVASFVAFVAAGWHGLKRVFLARAEPILERLRTDVTPEERALMGEYLGLGSDADAETITDAIQELGPTALQEAQREIRNTIQQNALDDMPGFRVWNGDEEARSMANAATEGGRLAVRQTVSGLGMLRGPRSAADGLTAVGYDSNISRLAEVAIEGCGDAAFNSLDAVFVGEPESSPPDLVQGSFDDDIEAAITALEGTGVAAVITDQAANTVIKHVMDRSPANVPVPSELHVGRGADSSVTLPADRTGSLLIQPSNRPPQESEVDLSDDVVVDYAFCATPAGPDDAGTTSDVGASDAGPTSDAAPSDADSEADTGTSGDATDYRVCDWFNVDASDRCNGDCSPAAAPIEVRGSREHPIYMRRRGVPTSGFKVFGIEVSDFVLHDVAGGSLPNEMVHGEYPAGTAPGNGTDPASSTSALPTEDGTRMTVRWDAPIDQPGGVMIMWTSMTYVWGADASCD